MKFESSSLTRLTDLGVGGSILFASDEWFAPACGLLCKDDPIFIPDKFTSYGKWMVYNISF